MLVTYFVTVHRATDHDVTVVSGRFQPDFPFTVSLEPIQACATPSFTIAHARVYRPGSFSVLGSKRTRKSSFWQSPIGFLCRNGMKLLKTLYFWGLAQIACQCRELVWEIRVKVSFDTSGLLSVRY